MEPRLMRPSPRQKTGMFTGAYKTPAGAVSTRSDAAAVERELLSMGFKLFHPVRTSQVIAWPSFSQMCVRDQ